MRRSQLWGARFLRWQWQFVQAQRGLLPTFNEAGMARSARDHFNSFRGFESWWDARKEGDTYFPEFVEWVEEQRSKAA